MLIGYARTSTTDQQAGFDAQLRDLEAAGCEKIFREQLSSVAASRPELAACLDYMREGDTLVITRLDRLARSITHLLEIVALAERKKVALRILSLGIDTGTASGRLILTVLGAIAEFERSLMLERQKEGIAKARADGRYKGRAPTVRRQIEAIRALSAEGVSTVDIARRLKVHRTSVYRALRQAIDD
jgi:DNA invertase Pin-like site-specific DNA recombinase